MDTIDRIIAYESGELDDWGMVELFSSLVSTGQAWSLQGHYGRTAMNLIDAGFIEHDGTITQLAIDTIDDTGF